MIGGVNEPLEEDGLTKCQFFVIMHSLGLGYFRKIYAIQTCVSVLILYKHLRICIACVWTDVVQFKRTEVEGDFKRFERNSLVK